jgi:Inner membrane component of T3SS, cytoplasmic domain/Domain of unknown function (DUF1707)
MAGVTGEQEVVRPAESRSADGMRASDAEREAVLAELRRGFAEGRLSHETFVYRVEATLRARRLGELDDQLADLPAPRRALAALARSLRAQRAQAGGQALAALARSRQVARTTAAAADSWLRAGRPDPPTLVLPVGPQQRYTIGREQACDMSIGDMTVSRWHADLRQSPAGWLLADLGSLNGTRLNGWRVTQAVPVRPGDVVSFGTVTFVLAAAPAPAR